MVFFVINKYLKNGIPNGYFFSLMFTFYQELFMQTCLL